MSKLITTLAAVGVVSLAAIASGPASAQPVIPRFSGMVKSSVAGCPQIAWRLGQSGDNVTGLVWYSDMSGASRAVGTLVNNKIHLDLTSIMGSGPVGAVDGTRGPNGGAVTKLVGTGCANAEVKMQPLPGGGWGTGG